MPGILLYPVDNYLPDKVGRDDADFLQSGWENPSTQVTALLDIVQLAIAEVIDGSQLYKASDSERGERGLAP